MLGQWPSIVFHILLKYLFCLILNSLEHNTYRSYESKWTAWVSVSHSVPEMYFILSVLCYKFIEFVAIILMYWGYVVIFLKYIFY